jgi:hypothetical protein
LRTSPAVLDDVFIRNSIKQAIDLDAHGLVLRSRA